MAPSIVGESLKGAELLATVMQSYLGYPCNPPPTSSVQQQQQYHRTDIIQAVQFGSRKKVDMYIFITFTYYLFCYYFNC